MYLLRGPFSELGTPSILLEHFYFSLLVEPIVYQGHSLPIVQGHMMTCLYLLDLEYTLPFEGLKNIDTQITSEYEEKW